MRLSTSQKEQFHERGWLVIKGLVPLIEVKKAARELDGIHEAAWAAEDRDGKLPWAGVGTSWDVTIPEGAAPRIEQLMGSDKVSPALDRMARSTAIVDALDQLMAPGEELRLFHSKTLMRAPEARSRFPWHQDFGYWHFGHKRPVELNCAVAIDAQTVESGCLQYVEGSQKRGLVPHTQFERLSESSFSIGLPGSVDAFSAVPVEYEPGDGLFFGSLVIHGSDINRTGKSARFNTFAYDLGGNAKDVVDGFAVRGMEERIAAMGH